MEALARKLAVLGIAVYAHKVSSKPLCNDRSRATSNEGIQNNAVSRTAGQDTDLD